MRIKQERDNNETHVENNYIIGNVFFISAFSSMFSQ